MSVRSNGSGDNLLCAVSLGLTTGAFTAQIYFNNLTDLNKFIDILGFGSEALDPATSLQTGTTTNGTSIAAFGGGGTPTEHASAVTTWYVVVLSRNGSNTLRLRVFADDASTTPIHETTATDGVNYSALDNILVGTLFTGEWPDAEFENCKIWIGAELTNAECRADASSYAVVRTANSFFAVELQNTNADTHGLNGTVGGLNFTNNGFVNGASTPAMLAGAAPAVVPRPPVVASQAVHRASRY